MSIARSMAGPAAFVLGAVHTILRPELEGDANDVVALLQQQGRRGRGVHSSAHAADNARFFLAVHKANNISASGAV